MTTPATMDDAISDLVARIDRRNRLGESIARAWQRVKPLVQAIPIGFDGMRHLTDENVRALSARLSKPDDPRVHRIEQDKRLNDILAELQLHKFLKSPFMNHPIQVPRHLLLTLDDLDPTMIERAQNFRQRLHGRSMLRPPATWPKNEEALWHFCFFLASLILDTGVLVPQILGVVIHLVHEDFTPAGTINLPRRRQRRGKRPIEATVRRMLHPVTLRAYTRFQRACRPFRKAGAPSKATDVCPNKWRTSKWMHHIFPSRLRAFLNACDIPADPFGSRHPLSQLLRDGTVTAVLRGIPPFIVDTAIGNVLTRPVTVSSYRRIFENKSSAWVLTADKAPGPARQGRISARTRIQSTGLDLFEKLEALRSRLRHSHDSQKERRAFIDEITPLIGPTPLQPIPGPLTQEAIFTANARVFGGFIAFLLRSKIKISSLLTRTSAVAAAFPDLFGSTPLWAWTARDYVNALRLGMEEHETDHFRVAFKWLVAFLNESGISTPTISWYDDNLQKPLLVTPAPLVGFDDFDRAIDTCFILDTIPDDLRELLQIMLILGFWVGLRAKEASRLTLRHYHPHPFHIIEVRNSRFLTSTRDMHLQYIVTLPYRIRLNAWYTKRLDEANGNRDAPFLGTGRQMRSDSKNPLGFYDSSYLSGLAGLILRCAIGEPISFHGLRHAFVSWLLLRLLATDGRITVNPSHPWASPLTFSPEAYDCLRPLLHGFSAPKPGQSECSHILMALCRLVGHANPTTTLEEYCHTLELAHALIESHLGGRG